MVVYRLVLFWLIKYNDDCCTLIFVIFTSYVCLFSSHIVVNIQYYRFLF